MKGYHIPVQPPLKKEPNKQTSNEKVDRLFNDCKYLCSKMFGNSHFSYYTILMDEDQIIMLINLKIENSLIERLIKKIYISFWSF